jgi:hypothetical protein
MPVSHRRVAQPPYLRRKPLHVAGQLLQLVNHDTTLSEGNRCTPLSNEGSGAAATPQAASNIGDFPVSGALPFRPRRYARMGSRPNVPWPRERGSVGASRVTG